MNKMINTDLALDIQSISKHGFSFALQQAIKLFKEGKYDSAIDWIYFAATLAWRTHPGFFYSYELETILANIGQELSCQNRNFSNVVHLSNTFSSKKKVLHVLSTAYLKGGHTRVVARWIENCTQYCPDQVNSILITNQGENIIPQWLISAVEGCGGEYIVFPDNFTWIKKAYFLKSIAEEWADIVVLHIHPNDPIANIAFSSIDFNIPILFNNHADHVFSIGMSISDIILDIRRSGQRITNLERGFPERSMLLPIPLIDPIHTLKENRETLRTEARKRLKISLKERILLTIGDEYKFKPALGYNFIDCARDILLQDNRIHIYAIGIPNNGLWKLLSDETKGQFHAVDIVTDYQVLRDYYLAADIYIEGFPFSSLTAMLDAGLYMLPIQRMHNPNAPILSGDDIALDSLVSIATNENEYINGVIRLINVSDEIRNNLGEKIRSSILANHCGETWINKWLRPIIEKVDNKDYKDKKSIQQDIYQVYSKPITDLSLNLSKWENRSPILIILDSLIRCTELPRIIRLRILLCSLRDIKLRHLFPLKIVLVYSTLYIIELIMLLLSFQERKKLKSIIIKTKRIAKIHLL